MGMHKIPLPTCRQACPSILGDLNRRPSNWIDCSLQKALCKLVPAKTNICRSRCPGHCFAWISVLKGSRHVSTLQGFDLRVGSLAGPHREEALSSTPNHFPPGSFGWSSGHKSSRCLRPAHNGSLHSFARAQAKSAKAKKAEATAASEQPRGAAELAAEPLPTPGPLFRWAGSPAASIVGMMI